MAYLAHYTLKPLKMKRTLALWLTLLTPGALVFLEVVGAIQRQGNFFSPEDNRWQHILEDVLSIWVILVLPLFITLETACLDSWNTATPPGR